MTPYWEGRGVRLYQGDCYALLPALGLDAGDVYLLTDPPYGVATDGGNQARSRSVMTVASDHPAIAGDDRPFDPAPFLTYGRVVLFGANHFASRLPDSPAWLSWDKTHGLTSRRAVGFNDSADVELAWSNLPGPARTFRHRWMGMLKDSERGQRRLHPTQKPVALMSFCLSWGGAWGTVVDPFCGVGATLIAALLAGLPAVGIELSGQYCRSAALRLSVALEFLEQRRA